MTDNFEDIEHQETVHPDEAPSPTGVRSNLAEAWRTRPLFKLVVVMVVAAVVVAVVSSFFSGGKEQQMSRLVNPPDIHEPPGGKASPYFIQQTKEAEKQRSKEALEKGTSSLPTPIGQPADINVTEKMDPMNELKSETEHLKQQLLQMQQQQIEEKNKAAAAAQVQAAPKAAPEQFDQSLSQAMQQQMRTLIEGWQPKAMKKVEVASKADEEAEEKAKKAGELPAGLGGLGGANVTPISTSETPENAADTKGLGDKSWFVPAGTVSYAQLLTEANSDVPVPILALIVSGPLNGAKAVGSFQVASGLSDYLVMTFKSATLKGRQYKINAIALDPDTTLGGMATETDQRYFVRLILPAAAEFLKGFGQALGQPNQSIATNGTTTVITQAGAGLDQGMFTGLGQAAQTASQFFEDQANQVKPLVRIAPNTPFAMFFVDSVCDWKTCKTDTEKATTPPAPAPTVPGYPYTIPTLPPGFPGLPGYGGANAQSQSGGGSSVPYPNYSTPSSGRSYGSPLVGGGYGGYGGFH